MEDIEIPQFFLCPISLQMIKDPVTIITGITYDRDSIEEWLKSASFCPITKQIIPKDSDLTPNVMLRRLIQAWCTTNAEYGIDRIPTPKSPLSKSLLYKLSRDLKVESLKIDALSKLYELANENVKWNRRCMAEAGLIKVMVLLIIRCSKENNTHGLEEALKILYLIWSTAATSSTPDQNGVFIENHDFDLIWSTAGSSRSSTPDQNGVYAENHDFVGALMWIVRMDGDDELKIHALKVLKLIGEVASSGLMAQLKVDFFEAIVTCVFRSNLPQQALKAALHFLIQSCPWGNNRMKIIEAGAVFDLIELELKLKEHEKRTTELILSLLAQLCSCADGRAQFMKHQAGIAMVSKRTLRVSDATDDSCMHILGQISRYSATNEVLTEMLMVGTVSKLCMVLQADCEPHLRKSARDMLRLHSKVWANSPCIQVYLLTRYNR